MDNNYVIDIIDKNAIYNNQFPEQIKFDNLIVGVNDYVNSNIALDNNTYLVVGQSNLTNYSDVTSNIYSLIVDSNGMAINSSLNARKSNKNTSNGLTIQGDILISGTLKGANPIDGSVINYTNYYTDGWKVTDTPTTTLYTDSNVRIGSSGNPINSLDIWGSLTVNGADLTHVTSSFQSSNITIISNGGCNLFYATGCNLNIGLSSTSNTIINVNPSNIQYTPNITNINYGSNMPGYPNNSLGAVSIGTSASPSIVSVTNTIQTDILKVSAIQIGNFIIKETYIYGNGIISEWPQGFPSPSPDAPRTYLTIQDTRLPNASDGYGTYYIPSFENRIYNYAPHT